MAQWQAWGDLTPSLPPEDDERSERERSEHREAKGEPFEASLFHVGFEQVPDNRAHPEGRRVGWAEFRALMETWDA